MENIVLAFMITCRLDGGDQVAMEASLRHTELNTSKRWKSDEEGDNFFSFKIEGVDVGVNPNHSLIFEEHRRPSNAE